VIARFGRDAMAARQVARRLRDLLPARYFEIRRGVRGERGAAADRLALTDERYLRSIDELVEVLARAREARIDYETHVMLYQARQTLRVFNARGASRGPGATSESRGGVPHPAESAPPPPPSPGARPPRR
jgi:hypothetical protein